MNDDPHDTPSDVESDEATPDDAATEATPTFDVRDLLKSIPLVAPLGGDRPGGESRSGGEPVQDSLDEIAEDMLDLLQRVQAMDARVQQISQQVVHAAQQQQGAAFTHGKELAALRSELLDERKAFVALFAFNAVIPVLDQLRQMEKGLDRDADARMLTQLSAVVGVLSTLIRNLGFEAFEAAPGDAFDPVQMECVAHESGTAGVVVRSIRAGYRCKSAVVRAAGVTLGETDTVNGEQPQEEGD